MPPETELDRQIRRTRQEGNALIAQAATDLRDGHGLLEHANVMERLQQVTKEATKFDVIVAWSYGDE